jgi:hypothetical protein
MSHSAPGVVDAIKELAKSIQFFSRHVVVHEQDIAKLRRRVAYLEHLVEQQGGILKALVASPTDMLIDGPRKHCTATEQLMRQRIQEHAMRTPITILEKLMPDEGEEET